MKLYPVSFSITKNTYQSYADQRTHIKNMPPSAVVYFYCRKSKQWVAKLDRRTFFYLKKTEPEIYALAIWLSRQFSPPLPVEKRAPTRFL
jgi:hypothetical protein